MKKKLSGFLLAVISCIFFISNAYSQDNSNVRSVKLEGGAVNISLPVDWARKGEDKLSQSAVFVKKVLAITGMVPFLTKVVL